MTYRVKEEPEDFTVKEDLNRPVKEGGDHLLLKVTKRQYNTEDMVEALANHANTPRHRFGYAGNKDRQAITTQHVSVKHGNPQSFAHVDDEDITVEHIGYTDSQLSLGDLNGNHFRINVKGVDRSDVNHVDEFTNYFDSQRFSTHNHHIGKHLVNGDYDKAANTLKDDDYHGPIIKKHLASHPNDYTTALRQLPTKILTLFVHAYQSQLWNRSVQRCHDDLQTQTTFPIIGFGTDPETEAEREELRRIKAEENITRRSFIIRSIPELSAEGTRRPIKQPLQDLQITPHPNGVTLSFYLDKGSYATMAIKHIFGNVSITT